MSTTAPVPYAQDRPSPGPYPQYVRPRHGRVVAGVASGAAVHLGVDVFYVRLAFLVGAFLSTEVASTVSNGIIREGDGGVQVTPTMIFAGLVGAVIWNLATWYLGLPSSSSHALFGGLIGAAVIGGVSLFGGKGTVIGVLLGVLFLSAVDNGLQLLGLSLSSVYAIKGGVILLAAVTDAIRHTLMARG